MLMSVVIGDNHHTMTRMGEKDGSQVKMALQQDTSTTARFWLDTLWEVFIIF